MTITIERAAIGVSIFPTNGLGSGDVCRKKSINIVSAFGCLHSVDELFPIFVVSDEDGRILRDGNAVGY